jgi:CheY-like chemotaxis protein
MRRIMIVDDEPSNRELAVVICRALGHEVVEATHGQEALAAMETECVDLVLLDGLMPVMDGLELTRALRAEPRWSHLPILGMTARAGQDDLRRMREAGVDDVLTKPFRSRQLMEAVTQLLEAARDASHAA